MSELKFTDEHEWALIEGDVATIGISGYAVEQLGDLVYIELPDVGRTLSAGDESATVESVKAASEVYAPLSGEVIEVNEGLTDAPGAVNDSPMDEGWFYKIKLTDPGEVDSLKDEDEYQTYVEGLD